LWIDVFLTNERREQIAGHEQREVEISGSRFKIVSRVTVVDDTLAFNEACLLEGLNEPATFSRETLSSFQKSLWWIPPRLRMSSRASRSSVERSESVTDALIGVWMTVRKLMLPPRQSWKAAGALSLQYRQKVSFTPVLNPNSTY